MHMKYLLNITTSILFMLPFMATAQHAGLDAALNKGNVADLGSYLADKVDISIPGTDASLSSTEAVRVLANFFTQNPVKGYNRAHLTAPQNGRSAYSLGDLYTANGTYRIYIYFDTNNKVSEIRIQQ